MMMNGVLGRFGIVMMIMRDEVEVYIYADNDNTYLEGIHYNVQATTLSVDL